MAPLLQGNFQLVQSPRGTYTNSQAKSDAYYVISVRLNLARQVIFNKCMKEVQENLNKQYNEYDASSLYDVPKISC